MTATDKYGQNISLWQMTDPPSIPDAIQAVADGVIPRGVMRFASASARGATITSPVAGMLAWLNDQAMLSLYDGTSWVIVAAGARPWTTIALVSPWAQNGNAQGNFAYRIVNLFGEDTIMLRGGISRPIYPGTMPSYFTLNLVPLPTTARPSSLRTILVPCSDVSSDRIALKLDITTDGLLNLYGADSVNKPPWVGFNGCFASL